MRRTFRNDYTAAWPAIALAVKTAAGWCCIRCGKQHHPRTGYTLTVDHWDGDKANNAWFNLLALCQRCHLSVQGRVIAERVWVLDHTPWFKPYVAGYYAAAYLRLSLSREEVERSLDWLLGIERRVVIDGQTTDVLRGTYQEWLRSGQGRGLLERSGDDHRDDAGGAAEAGDCSGPPHRPTGPGVLSVPHAEPDHAH